MKELQIIDASKELNILRYLRKYRPPFEVMGNYRLIDDGERPEATVTLKAGDQEMHEADIGVGPVDALANVLKKSLGRLFPFLKEVRLVDFQVNLIQGTIGTAAQVSVIIVFSDGHSAWKVFSSDDNINLAAFRALLDGYEYAIHRRDVEEQSAGPAAGPKAKPGAKAGTKKKSGTKAKAKTKSKAKKSNK